MANFDAFLPPAPRRRRTVGKITQKLAKSRKNQNNLLKIQK
jgi:hypothetical protein